MVERLLLLGLQRRQEGIDGRVEVDGIRDGLHDTHRDGLKTILRLMRMKRCLLLWCLLLLLVLLLGSVQMVLGRRDQLYVHRYGDRLRRGHLEHVVVGHDRDVVDHHLALGIVEGDRLDDMRGWEEARRPSELRVSVGMNQNGLLLLLLGRYLWPVDEVLLRWELLCGRGVRSLSRARLLLLLLLLRSGCSGNGCNLLVELLLLLLRRELLGLGRRLLSLERLLDEVRRRRRGLLLLDGIRFDGGCWLRLDGIVPRRCRRTAQIDQLGVVVMDVARGRGMRVLRMVEQIAARKGRRC